MASLATKLHDAIGDYRIEYRNAAKLLTQAPLFGGMMIGAAATYGLTQSWTKTLLIGGFFVAASAADQMRIFIFRARRLSELGTLYGGDEATRHFRRNKLKACAIAYGVFMTGVGAGAFAVQKYCLPEQPDHPISSVSQTITPGMAKPNLS